MKKTDNGKKQKKLTSIDIVLIVLLCVLVFAIVKLISGGNADDGKSADTNGDGKITLADYSGKKVGSITGVDYDDIIDVCLPGVEVMYYANYADLVVALKAGLIDAFIIDEPALYPIMRQDPSIGMVPEDMMPWDMAFIFTPKDPGGILCAQMSEFVRDAKQSGLMGELEGIWFGDDDSRKVIPPLEDLSDEAGTIRVALETTYEPIVYVKDQQIVGFEIDILYRFCQKYHYGMTITDMAFDAVLPAVISGKYDVGASGFEYNEEHLESVMMSEPHYSTGTYLAVNASDLGLSSDAGVAPGLSGYAERFKKSIDKNFLKEKRWQLVVKGIGTTCLITFLSILFGSILGFLMVMLKRSDSRLAGPIIDEYVRLIQGIPLVILLMILFYVIFGSSKIEAVWVAVIGFTLSFGAGAYGIMQSGLDSLDKGQREAALALGYTDTQAFLRFLFPQAAVRFLPIYCTEMIVLLNDTSIVGYIAVQDVTKMSDIIRSRSYEAAIPLITSTLIYFLLARVITVLMDRLLKRISPKRVQVKEGGED